MTDPTLPPSASHPPGFTPVAIGGEFMRINGPLYAREAGGVVTVAFRVEARHCNPRQVCHGGMLASFCDMLLPICAHRQSAEVGLRFLPTIGLQLDYLAPVPLGAWVEGTAQVLRATRSMVFLQGLVTADGVLAVRASGTFKLGPPFEA